MTDVVHGATTAGFVLPLARPLDVLWTHTVLLTQAKIVSGFQQMRGPSVVFAIEHRQ